MTNLIPIVHIGAFLNHPYKKDLHNWYKLQDMADVGGANLC